MSQLCHCCGAICHWYQLSFYNTFGQPLQLIHFPRSALAFLLQILGSLKYYEAPIRPPSSPVSLLQWSDNRKITSISSINHTHHSDHNKSSQRSAAFKCFWNSSASRTPWDSWSKSLRGCTVKHSSFKANLTSQSISNLQLKLPKASQKRNQFIRHRSIANYN